jgi:hypothetical protein
MKINPFPFDGTEATSPPYLRDFWKSGEISDYTDQEPITPIGNSLKHKENLFNPILESVSSGERNIFFRALIITQYFEPAP